MTSASSAAHGRVGPDHARAEAGLRLFQTGAPSHALSQIALPDEGPGHRLFLAVPRGPAPERGWPVLYMLDGNAAFDFLTPEHLALAPGLVRRTAPTACPEAFFHARVRWLALDVMSSCPKFPTSGRPGSA